MRCQDHEYPHIVLLYSSRRVPRLNRASPAAIPVDVERKMHRRQKRIQAGKRSSAGWPGGLARFLLTLFLNLRGRPTRRFYEWGF
jgi:hypothetical protein